MKKALLGILSITLIVACSNNEKDTSTETEKPTETVEDSEETVEMPEESNETEESLVEIDPVKIEREMWHFSDEKSYNIQVDVDPIIREGEYAILPLTLDSDSDEVDVVFKDLFDVGLGTGEGISSHQGYDIRLINSKENTVSHIAVQSFEDTTDAALQTFIGDGSRRSQMTIGSEHDAARYYAVFAAPTTEYVHVMFTGELGIVENIPVVDREDANVFTIQEIEDELNEETEEAIEERRAEIVPSVEEVIEKELGNKQKSLLTGYLEGISARAEPFESYRESVETTVSRIDEVEHSTLILSSDVLFDFGSADLTEEANTELEAAIAEMEGAEGGELEIIGHTDNVDTEEFNQTLSEDRAESVYQRLNELAVSEQFEEVDTRGESFREPIADNNTEEGRAQNRRVELHFTPPAEEVVIETEGELPEALGVETDYPETVQTRYGEIEVQSIRRVDDLLVGRVRVRPNEEGDVDYKALTQTAGIGARGWHSEDAGNYNQWSVYPVTLLHGNQRYYPIDYYLTPLEGSYTEEKIKEATDGINFIVPLADRNISDIRRIKEEGFYTATIVWPAVNSDTVTVDLTHSDVFSDHEGSIERTAPWRITNVPIEEGASDETTEDME